MQGGLGQGQGETGAAYAPAGRSSAVCITRARRLFRSPALLVLLPVLLAHFFASCKAVDGGDSGTDSGPFVLSECLGPPGSSSTPPDSGTGIRVLFVSADSLHFIVPFEGNCGLRYGFSAALPAPDTLAIASRVTGGRTAKCTCRKELTVSLKAEPGQSFDQIKVVKADAKVFVDFH